MRRQAGRNWRDACTGHVTMCGPCLILFLVAAAASLPAGQAPPPPAPHTPPNPPRQAARPLPPLPPGGVAGIQKKLAEVHSTGPVTDKILKLARMYLDRGDKITSAQDFIRSRDLGAADALVHAAEHQQHILEKEAADKPAPPPAPPGPPAPPPPPPGENVSDHLDHVYFRLQQADFFVAKSGDPNAAIIAEFARQYYEQARAANDQSDQRVADECAKSADDLMRALENLAQATAQKAGPVR